jgi:hypothetical protein
METPTFDPTQAVVFDLNRGRVTLEGSGAVLLSADALAQVCVELDATAVRQLGSLLGKQAGLRVKSRTSSSTLTLEAMADHLGGEISLGGLGSLGIERWGRALVIRIESCPLGARSAELMSAYVEAALQACVGRDASAIVAERGPDAFRLLLCGKNAANRVKGWLGRGKSFGEALTALHQNPREALGGN